MGIRCELRVIARTLRRMNRLLRLRSRRCRALLLAEAGSRRTWLCIQVAREQIALQPALGLSSSNAYVAPTACPVLSFATLSHCSDGTLTLPLNVCQYRRTNNAFSKAIWSGSKRLALHARDGILVSPERPLTATSTLTRSSGPSSLSRGKADRLFTLLRFPRSRKTDARNAAPILDRTVRVRLSAYLLERRVGDPAEADARWPSSGATGVGWEDSPAPCAALRDLTVSAWT
ncbi:MAG: hypothetical protein JWN04_2407 [Myxococcaceae bacterium]|nr:hypothetical protein [Myxococcaceae bacterium]